MAELKKCAKCGFDAIQNTDPYYVECSGPQCGRCVQGNTPEEAAEMWNRANTDQPDLSTIQQQLADATQALSDLRQSKTQALPVERLKKWRSRVIEAPNQFSIACIGVGTAKQALSELDSIIADAEKQPEAVNVMSDEQPGRLLTTANMWKQRAEKAEADLEQLMRQYSKCQEDWGNAVERAETAQARVKALENELKEEDEEATEWARLAAKHEEKIKELKTQLGSDVREAETKGMRHLAQLLLEDKPIPELTGICGAAQSKWRWMKEQLAAVQPVEAGEWTMESKRPDELSVIEIMSPSDDDWRLCRYDSEQAWSHRSKWRYAVLPPAPQPNESAAVALLPTIRKALWYDDISEELRQKIDAVLSGKVRVIPAWCDTSLPDEQLATNLLCEPDGIPETSTPCSIVIFDPEPPKPVDCDLDWLNALSESKCLAPNPNAVKVIKLAIAELERRRGEK